MMEGVSKTTKKFRLLLWTAPNISTKETFTRGAIFWFVRSAWNLKSALPATIIPHIRPSLEWYLHSDKPKHLCTVPFGRKALKKITLAGLVWGNTVTSVQVILLEQTLGTIQVLRHQRGGWVGSENGNFWWLTVL